MFNFFFLFLQVESLDEDHLLVKAAMSQNIIREVELNVRVVTLKEFKDCSRVINKDMYDKFKVIIIIFVEYILYRGMIPCV